MVDKVQVFLSNLNFSQKKSEKKVHIADYPPDTFVRSNKSLSFKGNIPKIIPVSYNFLRGDLPREDFLEDYLLEELQKKGVNTIISLTTGLRKSFVDKIQKLGFTHHIFDFTEDIDPSPEEVKRFLKIFDDPNVVAFTHCREGINRTGLMTAIYNVCKRDYNFRNAYTDMLKRGYKYNDHPNMREFLKQICIAQGKEKVEDIDKAILDLSSLEQRNSNMRTFRNSTTLIVAE